MKIMIINGANLNFLGIREPEVYGKASLEDINHEIDSFAKEQGHEVTFVQSNYEGQIIDYIQQAYFEGFDGMIINPGAFTHYSYAIHDALSGNPKPAIEIHMSNIHQREAFRQKSVLAPACIGQISGFGAYGYKLAILALEQYTEQN